MIEHRKVIYISAPKPDTKSSKTNTWEYIVERVPQAIVGVLGYLIKRGIKRSVHKYSKLRRCNLKWLCHDI